MPYSRRSAKIALLGDYPPRKCGIATFTRDLRNGLAALMPDWDCPVISVTEKGMDQPYPVEVRFEIPENDIGAYERAADFLNLGHIDVLCLQHEFGIYGGEAGSHILALLKRARMPTVTTLHTILENPCPEQRRVFDEVLRLSTRLVVMSERGATMLRDRHHVPDFKISIIPHGIPDIPFVDPNFYKDHFGVAGRMVLLTFGLLSPGKGIEYAIRALPDIAREHPNVVYIILGATHPNLLKTEGETYRLGLERLAKSLHVEENVRFVNRYVPDQELCEFIGAADFYLTPYLNAEQITSGTLSYCFGAGKAVVSTPYWHAQELLSDNRGEIVPFRDPAAIARSVNMLLANPARRHAMRKQAYMLGRRMVWSQVAQDYSELFDEAIREFQHTRTTRYRRKTLLKETSDLPQWRFDHLRRMSDSTGVFQHAIFTVPWFEHGYCTDDNARALLLAAMLEHLGESPGIHDVQAAAAAFLQNAFVHRTGRFRNFMNFERHWIEQTGSEDSHGRAMWALGATVGLTRQPALRAWAANLFENALPPTSDFNSPRAWAFTLLGLQEYFRAMHGDLKAERVRTTIAGNLLQLFSNNGGHEWPWGEDIVAYDNARLPQALLVVGRWTGNEEMKRCGLESLRWLMKHQYGDSGCFRPVGSNGFWLRGEKPAQFDQQPIEAAAAVSACIDAYHATDDATWKKDAQRAFAWFVGDNDLALPLYDATTGGCRDGLHENRMNQNQGAESSLSFLLALADMHVLHNTSAAFNSNG